MVGWKIEHPVGVGSESIRYAHQIELSPNGRSTLRAQSNHQFRERQRRSLIPA